MSAITESILKISVSLLIVEHAQLILISFMGFYNNFRLRID